MTKFATGFQCARLLSPFTLLAFLASSAFADPFVIRNDESWPVVVELSTGDTYDFARSFDGNITKRQIRIVSVNHRWEPDHWIEGNPRYKTLSRADVIVEVDGQQTTLVARPYQMPVSFGGLRLYVESTRTWAKEAEYAALEWFGGDVRLSICSEDEPWGPKHIDFPIGQYRWRSSSYQNTWLSLVAFNKLYYHRGEDLAAIPNRLPVIAMMDGTVSASPLPDGDGASNAVMLKTKSGMEIRYAHMDTPSIRPGVQLGNTFRKGDILGLTGMTWDGRLSQVAGHHLHVEFRFGGTRISTFPYFVAAYFRSYPDNCLAIAGGYHLGEPRKTITLDGSRSIPRPGKKIVGYRWELSDGRTLDGPFATIAYEQPGVYSEGLVVVTDDGGEHRDFAQVIVNEESVGRRIPYGWLHYTPTRGIRPGTSVTFENRLLKTVGDVNIDFGDGTSPESIDDSRSHRYAMSGQYVVTLTGRGSNDVPIQAKVRVVVEPK